MFGLLLHLEFILCLMLGGPRNIFHSFSFSADLWFQLGQTHHSPTHHCIFFWLCGVSLKQLYVPVSLLQSRSAWPHAKHPSIGPPLWDKHFTLSSSKLAYWNSIWYGASFIVVVIWLFFVGFYWVVEGFKLFCFVISPKFVLEDLELEISIMKTNERQRRNKMKIQMKFKGNS